MATIVNIVIPLFKSLTILRLLNLLSAVCNYLFLKIKQSHRPTNNPITITLELSSVCNLACPECPVGMGKVKRDNKFLDLDLAKSIIDRHYRHAIVAIMYFQGEPMLNPSWSEIVQYARKKNLYTIMSTNAQLLDAINCKRVINSGLNRIILSAEGIDQSVYEQYRIGGSFLSVVEGLKKLSIVKREAGTNGFEIVYQTLLTKYTENHLHYIRRKALSWGADRVEFKTIQIYNQSQNNIDKWLPTRVQYQRKNLRKGYRYKVRSIVCWRLLTNAVYTADGVLLPCCFDKLGEYPFGLELNKAWHSNARMVFINRLRKGRDNPDICRNCTVM